MGSIHADEWAPAIAAGLQSHGERHDLARPAVADMIRPPPPAGSPAAGCAPGLRSWSPSATSGGSARGSGVQGADDGCGACDVPGPTDATGALEPTGTGPVGPTDADGAAVPGARVGPYVHRSDPWLPLEHAAAITIRAKAARSGLGRLVRREAIRRRVIPEMVSQDGDGPRSGNPDPHHIGIATLPPHDPGPVPRVERSYVAPPCHATASPRHA